MEEIIGCKPEETAAEIKRENDVKADIPQSPRPEPHTHFAAVITVENDKKTVFEIFGYESIEKMLYGAGQTATRLGVGGDWRVLYSGETKELARKNMPAYIHNVITSFETMPEIINIFVSPKNADVQPRILTRAAKKPYPSEPETY